MSYERELADIQMQWETAAHSVPKEQMPTVAHDVCQKALAVLLDSKGISLRNGVVIYPQKQTAFAFCCAETAPVPVEVRVFLKRLRQMRNLSAHYHTVSVSGADSALLFEGTRLALAWIKAEVLQEEPAEVLLRKIGAITAQM